MIANIIKQANLLWTGSNAITTVLWPGSQKEAAHPKFVSTDISEKTDISEAAAKEKLHLG